MSVFIPAVMPPLLPEEHDSNFNRKNSDTVFTGKAAEYIVGKYFLKNKINFGEPLVDQGTDWWVQEDSAILRAQVKKVSWKLKVDSGIKKRTGKIVKREVFDFRFQSAGSKSDANINKKFYGPNDIDVFYHVLVTPLRELIWRIPSNLVSLDNDGWFVQSKSSTIDRPFVERRKAYFDLRGKLISCMYDAKIVQAYPDFFLPPKQPDLLDFFK